jgi:hypothetical protein
LGGAEDELAHALAAGTAAIRQDQTLFKVFRYQHTPSARISGIFHVLAADATDVVGQCAAAPRSGSF